MNEAPTLRTESMFRLTWPIFLQHATGSVVLFVDFVFLGYLSDEIAGIVGQILPVTWVGSFIIPVFAGTGISVASQFMGAKHFEKVVPTYMLNLLLCVTLGLIIGGSAFFLRESIGAWMGLNQFQNSIASLYLGCMSLYFIVMSVMVAYNAILSSRGLTNWLMVVSLVCGVANIILNSWFVFGLKLGVVGIVGSTVISTFISASIAVFLVHNKLKIAFYLKGAVKDMIGIVMPMMKLGIPNVVEPLSYVIQQIILSTIVISMGVQSMASNAFAGRMHMPHIVFCFSMASAAQILMAHWMGAGKIRQIDQLFWRIVQLAVGVAFVYMVIIWTNAFDVIRIFTDDPEIRLLCKRLLMISLITEPSRMINILAGFSLRSLGDTRYPVIVGLIFIWGILPIILVIDNYWSLTIVGIWICFAADEFLRALVNLHRWKWGKWKTMGLVQKRENERTEDKT